MRSMRAVAAICVCLMMAVGGAMARNPELGQAQQATAPVEEMAGKPYRVRFQVDTPTPVVYGDDVVVSVWINPLEGFDLEAVRIHPKGVLASLYRGGAPTPGELGIACGTPKERHREVGVAFVATCRLIGAVSGFRRAFNWAAVLPNGQRQHFEVEVVLQEDLVTTSHYEFGTIEFVSPVLSVIIGAILGSAIWALFLPISTPVPNLVIDVKDGWGGLLRKMLNAIPQLLARWFSFLVSVLRSVVLGGATAIILIILARTTEGLDTPIALQVKDMWGGLLVGIFSGPLSRWIRQRVEALAEK